MIGEYQNYYLWAKDKNTDWIQPHKSAYEQLPSEVSKKLKSVVDKNLRWIKKNINFGAVRLLINTIRDFQEGNISTLFKAYGFEIERTFLLKDNGHLFLGNDPYNGEVSRIGIIVKYSRKDIGSLLEDLYS